MSKSKNEKAHSQDKEFREEVSMFTEDIWRWINEEDFTSAAQIASALAKFIRDVKKNGFQR